MLMFQQLYLTKSRVTIYRDLFIDIFDDVNKPEFDNDENIVLTLAENITYIIYGIGFEHNLTANQRMMTLLKLTQRGFLESTFDDRTVRPYFAANNIYNTHKVYITKYYDTIINLFRLTNSIDIDICNLNDSVIDAIRVLLLIVKTRGLHQEVALKSLPKYVILHKILLFYLR